jgi:plastocyanin
MPLLSNAEDVVVMVRDQFGQPLSDVVIEPVTDDIVSASDADPAVMDQINKRFQPEQLVIRTDRKVDFPNSDNIRHHVYSFSRAKTFELKLYADKPESPVTFPKHGVVVLGCNIHDTMIAYIFVSRSAHTTVTESSGKATLDKALANKFNIWHKQQAIGPEQIITIDLTSMPRNEQGQYVLEIETREPEPTNSFEDTFSGVSQTDQTSE